MAAVDLNTVRSVIEGRLATELASSPALPVVFHNMAYEPTPNSSWVQCLVSFGANEYLSQGLTTDSQNRVVGFVAYQYLHAKRCWSWGQLCHWKTYS